MTTEIERADAIRWIRAQMLDYGLTMEELDARGCFAPPPSPRSVGYRNAEGLCWDGLDAGLPAAHGQRRADGGAFPRPIMRKTGGLRHAVNHDTGDLRLRVVIDLPKGRLSEAQKQVLKSMFADGMSLHD